MGKLIKIIPFAVKTFSIFLSYKDSFSFIDLLMLKKAIHISVVLFLLISTMGVTIYKHYCSGTLISKSVGLPAKKCCNDNCKDCRNESKTFKITTDYDANSNSLNFKAEVKKIFDNFSFTFILIHTTLSTIIDKNILTSIKTCDTPLLIAENSSAMLQVFRL